MELEELCHRRSGIFYYFGGATINNLVINSGTEYHHQSSTDNRRNKEYSDEQIAKAIKSINGKDNVLNNYQMWLGVCCLLSNKYGFPHNLEKCCERIINLPYEGDGPELECKYESIRKFAYMRFVKEDVDDWESYTPKVEEERLFYNCRIVAKELEKAINRGDC